MLEDYENEKTNDDVKKRKLEKSDAMLRDDEIGETSGSNKMRKTDAIIEDESGEASKKRKNKKDMKKRNKK
ncbi:19341_t:CDS:2 [Cetraspora pellucida]|uniref:19341_t:CDS:1 n=1 Tax=Cetraspora pellucida TaxID=1433469 RepID=A0A9N8W0A3_9GLOM|nr:19341_t:CDS:2 [Cetraspora pellucida]